MVAPAHNLPIQPTPLIGRDQAIDAAVHLLSRDDVHLLTVTGPAGVGKSRLALAVGSLMLRDFEHGAWFVDLAAIDSPSLVLPTIGWTLGLREGRETPIMDSLRDHLVRRHLLLVLDNFEHVIAAGPHLSDLLSACPQVKALVTSRAPLHLRWEQELEVGPLDLPAIPEASDHVAIAKVPSVALFLERARAIEPSFVLDQANTAPIAALCRQLDGLPLAIELAAARVRLLSPRAILARLVDGIPATSLNLLAAGSLDMPPRHQTLRAAIGWSHDLLSAEHRVLFRRLAVFVGGFTLEMAERVCCGSTEDGDTFVDGPILDSLGVLVENHLLQLDAEIDGEPRLRMLATIREFAVECLDASGEADEIRRRHAVTMMALAQDTRGELGGPREGRVLALLEREYENLRAALAYLVRSDDVSAGLQASRALWRLWSIRGPLSDGRAWLTALLERDRETAAPTLARSLALSAAGWTALEQDDIAAATVFCNEGLAIARSLGDAHLEAEHLSQIGHAARQQGDFPLAQAHYVDSLAIRRAANDHLGIAWSLRNLAHVARLRGDYEQSCALYEESLAIGGAQAPRSEVAGTLGYLGNALLRRGSLDQAQQRFAESLTICRDIGHRRRLAYAIEGLAGVAAARGSWARALRLGGAAAALRKLIGAPLWPAGHSALEHRLEPAWQQLGPARAAECWAAGSALSLDVVMAEALADDAPAPPDEAAPAMPPATPANDGSVAVAHPLTHRELQVARLIADGRTNRQIGAALVISEGTAAVHVKHILNKLDLESRAQIAVWIVRHGLAADAG